MMWRVIETDNFGGDYPDETFCGPPCRLKWDAQAIANACNAAAGHAASRFWRVVDENYRLQPGFEP